MDVKMDARLDFCHYTNILTEKALACIQGQLQRLANFCELGQVQKSNIRINNNFTF